MMCCNSARCARLFLPVDQFVDCFFGVEAMATKAKHISRYMSADGRLREIPQSPSNQTIVVLKRALEILKLE